MPATATVDIGNVGGENIGYRFLGDTIRNRMWNDKLSNAKFYGRHNGELKWK